LTIKRLAFEPVLVKHLETLGIDHRSVTSDLGFKKLDRQGRLYRLALFAKGATGDDLLGLRIGKKVRINGFGPLSYAIVSAPTPRHVLQTSIKYMRIFQSHPPNPATLSTGRSNVVFEYKHPIRLKGFTNFVPDLFFASNLQTLSQLGADLAGVRLELDYAPTDIAAYRAEIGIPVTFKAGRNRLIMPQAAIDALWSAVEADPALPVTVDLTARQVRAAGETWAFPLDDFTRWRLLEGLDDIGLTLRHEAEIDAFETGRPAWLPRTKPV